MNRNLFIRLAFAAHRVADALPDEELKQEIKESANAILADLILFIEKEGVLADKKRSLTSQILRQVDILAVYLDKAKREGMAELENFLILESEYARIRDFLEIFDSMQGEHIAPASAIVPEKKEKERVSQPVVEEKKAEASPATKQKESGELTDRQRKIIEFLKRKDKAQVWEFQKILPQVTKRTLRRDLDSLLQLNLVERKGEWNSVVYELKEKGVVV